MKPVSAMPTDACLALRGLLCDLDDTLTTEGRLVPRAFDALWRAHEAGLRTVLVTGRPAGWADHFARMWPLDAVVGENGAFYFHMKDGKMQRRWVDDEATRADKRARLAEIGRRILEAVPGAAVAADQFCRASDLAIDFCEDVPGLAPEAIDQIVAEFEAAGATAKVSSIHVNGWLGHYDKLSCMRLAAEELWGEDLALTSDRYVFCGDSPNDEPMFAFFPLATAVANISDFAHRIQQRPAYVASLRGGEGFAELVDHILERREPGGRLSSPSWSWS